MDYMNDLAVQYGGLISALGSLFGIAGVIFGLWRYSRERAARKALKERQLELDNALARLDAFGNFASGIDQYSKAS